MSRPPISSLGEVELSRRRLAQLGLAAPSPCGPLSSPWQVPAPHTRFKE